MHLQGQTVQGLTVLGRNVQGQTGQVRTVKNNEQFTTTDNSHQQQTVCKD